ncbi:MAG TPA: KxYKxGKxW signal peptide domain-containing protein, partial [Ligilactobacillus aviarius]|nr:KxYKxGKxW signal peptide domain-containing protein [Ligilactobacillus aviarius]
MKSKSYIGNRYNRVKLYKKGKFWVASSITFLSLGIGAGVSTVHAAPISSSSRNEEVEEVSSSSASKINARSFSSIHMQPQSVASSVIEASASQKSSLISSSRESQSQTDSSVLSSVQSSSSVSSASSTSKQSSAVKSSSSKQASSSSEEVSSESSSSLKSSSSSAVKISKKNEDHVSKASTASSMTKIDGPDADKALTSDLTDKENTILGPNSGIKLIQSTPVIANRKNDEEDQANDTEATLKNAIKAEDVARVRSHNSVLDANEGSYGDWTIYFVTTSGEAVHASIGYKNMYGYQVESDLETTITTIENEGYQYIADLPIT